MKSKAPLRILIITTLILSLSSCIVEKEDKRQEYQEHLLAQASVVPGSSIEESTIEEVIAGDIGFSTLKSIVESTNFIETFDTSKPFTIFAPINTAFNKFPKATIQKLIDNGDTERLSKILNCHIIPDQISEEAIKEAIKTNKGSVHLKTLGDTKLIATLKRNTIFLIDKQGNGGRLITTDVKTANGYIHTIDGVMMPKE